MSKMQHGVRRARARVAFVPVDAWVGLYIGPKQSQARLYTALPDTTPHVYLYKERKLFLCFIPFFPIIVSWRSV